MAIENQWTRPGFFNNHALAVVLIGLVSEVAEDLFVKSEVVLKMHPWKEYVADVFDTMAALNPNQLGAVDNQGVHIDRSSLGFHGVRWVTRADLLTTYAPAVAFSYCLYTLLLGAGYVH